MISEQKLEGECDVEYVLVRELGAELELVGLF
jgi:hypothetical protein